jgi:zinc transporter 1
MSHVAEDSRHLSDVEDVPEPNDEDLPHERTALLSHQGSSSPAPSTVVPKSHGSDHGHGHGHGHGHSHGSMNMQAVLLHVLGDALGNVGVIAAGLVIWLTEWKYKYYFDPLISLIITIIIFSSALPLGMILTSCSCLQLTLLAVRSASFILLQGVPTSVSLDEVRAEILSVEGVLSVHELHVWQLSESKVVASVHVTASRDVDFMITASAIRERLHRLGIHSSTIQPEYHGRNAPPDQALKVGPVFSKTRCAC